MSFSIHILPRLVTEFVSSAKFNTGGLPFLRCRPIFSRIHRNFEDDTFFQLHHFSPLYYKLL